MIKEIRLITNAIKNSTCKECLNITISQLKKNCTTPTILDLKAGSDKTFSGSQIGVCHNFSIDMNLPLDLKFQHLNNNGWKGELAFVYTKSNSFNCDPITQWLDRKGKNGDSISSLIIKCKAAGN